MSEDKDVWGVPKDIGKKKSSKERFTELLWVAAILSGLFVIVWILRGNSSVPQNQLRWALGIFIVSVILIFSASMSNKR